MGPAWNSEECLPVKGNTHMSLETVRAELLKDLDNLAGPTDMIRFQRKLANAIKEAENSGDAKYREHRRLLRLS